MRNLWKKTTGGKRADIFLWMSLIFYAGMVYFFMMDLQAGTVQGEFEKKGILEGIFFALGGLCAVISGIFTEHEITVTEEDAEALSLEELKEIYKMLKTLN